MDATLTSISRDPEDGGEAARTVPFDRMFPPWPAPLGVGLDVLCLLATVTLPVLGVLGSEGPVRKAAAVLVICLAPGWGTLRAARMTASTFTLLMAFVCSVLLAMLVGLVAVTRLQWHWLGGLALIEVISAVGLALALLHQRPFGLHRSRAVIDNEGGLSLLAAPAQRYYSDEEIRSWAGARSHSSAGVPAKRYYSDEAIRSWVTRSPVGRRPSR